MRRNKSKNKTTSASRAGYNKDSGKSRGGNIKSGDIVKGRREDGKEFTWDAKKHKRDVLTGRWATNTSKKVKEIASKKKEKGFAKETKSKVKPTASKDLAKKIRDAQKPSSTKPKKPETKTPLSKGEQLAQKVRDAQTSKDLGTEGTTKKKKGEIKSTDTDKIYKEVAAETVKRMIDEMAKLKDQQAQAGKEKKPKGVTENEDGFTAKGTTQPKGTPEEAVFNRDSLKDLQEALNSKGLSDSQRKLINKAVKSYDDETEQAVISQLLTRDQPTKTQQVLADKVRLKVLKGESTDLLTSKQMISAKAAMVKHHTKGKLTKPLNDGITGEAVTKFNEQKAKAEASADKLKNKKLKTKTQIKDAVKDVDGKAAKILAKTPNKPDISYAGKQADKEKELNNRVSKIKSIKDVDELDKLANDIYGEMNKVRNDSRLTDKEKEAKVDRLFEKVDQVEARITDLNKKETVAKEEPAAPKTKYSTPEVGFTGSDEATNYLSRWAGNEKLTPENKAFIEETGVDELYARVAQKMGVRLNRHETDGSDLDQANGFFTASRREVSITNRGLRQAGAGKNKTIEHELIHSIQYQGGTHTDPKGKRRLNPIGFDVSKLMTPSEASKMVRSYSDGRNIPTELEAFATTISPRNTILASAVKAREDRKLGSTNSQTSVDWWKEVGEKIGLQGIKRHKDAIDEAARVYPDLKPYNDEIQKSADVKDLPPNKLTDAELSDVQNNISVNYPKFLNDAFRNSSPSPDKSKALLTEAVDKLEIKNPKIKEVIDKLAGDDDEQLYDNVYKFLELDASEMFSGADGGNAMSIKELSAGMAAMDLIMSEGIDSFDGFRAASVTKNNIQSAMVAIWQDSNDAQKRAMLKNLGLPASALGANTQGILKLV